MLRRLALRDVVLVRQLELALEPGFTVLTGETGAGKSILVEALQLALGSRADATRVREGAPRAEVSAEFDLPAHLLPWLEEGGFDAAEGTLLLRRTVDAQGRSRAWINGSAATVAQLRELAEHLVDIHGQHAWQGLTRPATVRALLDAQAGVAPARLAERWQAWRAALGVLDQARAARDTLERERERLAWQVGELDKLAPAADEWRELEAEHQRLAHGQALLDAARAALDAVGEGEPAADALLARALGALDDVARYDTEVASIAEVLRSAQAQLQDAAHSLHAYLGHREPDPGRLAELDARLSAWVQLARRHRRSPAELPALLASWKLELQALDAAADLEGLERAAGQAEAAWRTEAKAVSAARARAAPRLAAAVTQVMQTLGMAGGRFEVALLAQDEPQAFGLEAVELRVAGHAGSTPRALAKIASGGELSRLALAVAVTTSRGAGGGEANADRAGAGATHVATLVFDEIDSGVGGTVADSVGALMKQLGRTSQVLAVTHLAQVAACADQHLVVSKAADGGATTSAVRGVAGEARVAEVARMLGGASLSGTAHAQAMLARGERERR
ncbi:MAG: DNA repair protein RecN [Rubrivivax sp. SCN 71-131]|jgi:DNA repair protein RecN (Recombination protein N)|nr:MAG: DNA repair protein RecN [Rubrivivax sp. SCN 71-131]